MPQSISCAQCGAQYRWKPELAGKTVKCKCGGAIQVPAASPAPAPSPAPSRGPAHICPACSSNMPPGAVLCVHCGFDLKRGKAVATQAEAAPAPTPAQAAVAAYADRIPRRYQAEPAASTSRSTAPLIVAFILLIVALIGGAYYLRHGPGQAAMRGPQVGDDAKIQGMIDDQGITELRQWLNERDDRMLLNMTRQQAFHLADRLYQMGARKVWAFKGRACMSIVVDLPDDPKQRKELWDYHLGKWYDPRSGDVRSDVGQKYLLIRLVQVQW